MRAILLSLALSLAVPVAAQADPARIDRLVEVTRLDEILGVMEQEGLAYADTLERDLFPGKGGAGWDLEAAQIHDRDASERQMREAFAAGLAGPELDPVLDFFASPLGQKITGAELSAREAMLDDAVDEAAREAVADLDPDRERLLRRFISVNDLIESNVVGGLNSNYAFYRGLVDGGAFPYDLGESEMLAEVWSQEPELRSDTEAWLLSYLGLAYSVLSDEELARYVEVSESDAGAAFNRALFGAFDQLFNDISYRLGLAAARYMSGEDA